MELTWIEDFLALQRTQNFTEAAAQRCTTQPAFSRRVQQLEEWLGTTLFDRYTPRSPHRQWRRVLAPRATHP